MPDHTPEDPSAVPSGQTEVERAARSAELTSSQHASFLRWSLVRFSTRAHFMRFICSGIMISTVIMLLGHYVVPDAWWGIVGLSLGYYFRGSTAGVGHD